MKKILIEAYTQLNLGDDLFIKILANRYTSHKFYLLTYFKYEKLTVIKNLNIVKYNLIEKIINKVYLYLNISQNYIKKRYLKNIDIVIEIGGSLFIENEFYKNKLKFRKEILNGVNKNYYLIGSNFGPYNNKNYENEYKSFFSECKDVCFREKFSYNIFKELKNIRIAKDIVFSLEDNINISNDYILYSIIKPSIRKELKEQDENYYNQIIETTIELIKKGKKIKYMSFCKAEGDEEAIQIILNSIPKEYLNSISTYYYSGDIDEALEVLKKAEIVIATRFHAMILGFIYGKKVLPIAYSKKTINVLKDLEFKGMCVEFDSLKDLNVENILYSGKLEEEKLKEAKQDSQKHFEKLDLYLLESDKK